MKAYVQRNLNIIGLGRILDETRSKVYRLIWICLLLMALAFLFYHLRDRIIYYASGPVNADVHIKEPDFLQFPAVTVCFKIKGRQNLLEDDVQSRVFQAITKDSNGNFTEEELRTFDWEKFHNSWPKPQSLIRFCLWTESSIAFVTNSCGPGAFHSPKVTDLMFSATIAHCYTIYKKEWKSSGSDSKLTIALNDTVYGEKVEHKLIVHSFDQAPRIREGGIEIGYRDGRNVQVDIDIRRSEFESIEPRCGQRKLRYFKDYLKFHCIIDCFINFSLANACHCVAAYGIPFYENSKICHPNDWHECFEKAWYSFTRGSKSNAKCGCKDPCHKQLFEPSVKSTVTQRNSRLKGLNIVHLKLPTTQHTVIKQTTAISFLRLLTEIGGALSLFLGIRLMTIVEVLDIFGVGLHRRMNDADAENNRKKAKTTTTEQRRIPFVKSMGTPAKCHCCGQILSFQQQNGTMKLGYKDFNVNENYDPITFNDDDVNIDQNTAPMLKETMHSRQPCTLDALNNSDAHFSVSSMMSSLFEQKT